MPDAPAPLVLLPLDPRYPSRLRALERAPTLSTLGGPLDAAHAVGIVGSRDAHPEAAKFARSLAFALARAGVVIISGGARGIDAAAHGGALDAGGRTWAVAGTGSDHCFPPQHADLFAAIAAGPGAMIWPFAPASAARAGSFLARNRVLVALADALVVVQAGGLSGAMRAAACALLLAKPLWVVPAAPWSGDGFIGSRQLLERGARPLVSAEALLSALCLPPPEPGARSPKPGVRAPQAPAVPTRPLSEAESAVLGATSTVPRHLDEIASRAGVPASAAGGALLTLALENVLVEGPAGFYRRRDLAND